MQEIGKWAIVKVPGQHGGNVTHEVLHCHATSWPYVTLHLLTVVGGLEDILFGWEQQDHEQAVLPVYVVVWGHISFHCGVLFTQQLLNVCLKPYSPYLNPIEEFFSAWWWKVYD